MQTSTKWVLGVIAASIVAAPFTEPINWAINRHLDANPDELPDAIRGAWAVMQTAAQFIPSGLFIGIAVGATIAFILLRAWKPTGPRKAEIRRNLIQRWREMALECQRKADQAPDDKKASIKHFQRHFDYEEFNRIFHNELETYMSSMKYRLHSRWRKLTRRPPINPLTDSPSSRLEDITLDWFVRRVLYQIAWLEKRWKIHGDRGLMITLPSTAPSDSPSPVGIARRTRR